MFILDEVTLVNMKYDAISDSATGKLINKYRLLCFKKIVLLFMRKQIHIAYATTSKTMKLSFVYLQSVSESMPNIFFFFNI